MAGSHGPRAPRMAVGTGKVPTAIFLLCRTRDTGRTGPRAAPNATARVSPCRGLNRCT